MLLCLEFEELLAIFTVPPPLVENLVKVGRRRLVVKDLGVLLHGLEQLSDQVQDVGPNKHV